MDIYEVNAIAEVRQKLGNLLEKTPHFNNDLNIARFLRGYDYDVPAVVPILRHHLRFRLAAGLEKDVIKVDPNISQYFPIMDTGVFSHSGDLLTIEIAAKQDIDSILRTFSLSNILQNVSFRLETNMRMVSSYADNSLKPNGHYLVYDLSNTSSKYGTLLKLLSDGMFRSYIEFVLNNFVECTQHILVINTPSFFWYLWNILKGFVPEKSQGKVTVCSEEGWQEVLMNDFNRDDLPVKYGGDLVLQPAEKDSYSVPKDLHWSGEITGIDGRALNENTVHAGGVMFISFYLDEEQVGPNATLHWKFWTTMASSSFGVFLSFENLADSEDMEMIYPEFRPFPEVRYVPEEAIIKLVKPGYYKIKFGNSDSRFWSLKVKHSCVCCADDGKLIEPKIEKV